MTKIVAFTLICTFVCALCVAGTLPRVVKAGSVYETIDDSIEYAITSAARGYQIVFSSKSSGGLQFRAFSLASIESVIPESVSIVAQRLNCSINSVFGIADKGAPCRREFTR